MILSSAHCRQNLLRSTWSLTLRKYYWWRSSENNMLRQIPEYGSKKKSQGDGGWDVHWDCKWGNISQRRLTDCDIKCSRMWVTVPPTNVMLPCLGFSIHSRCLSGYISFSLPTSPIRLITSVTSTMIAFCAQGVSFGRDRRGTWKMKAASFCSHSVHL
jgi:hypothetical protein